MSLITWSDKYSVKNLQIDTQHKKLVSLINELHDAMRTGTAKTKLEKILNDLILYTKEHFRTEEQLMQKANYKNFPIHKNEHENLTVKVVDLQKAVKAGTANITIELMNFLRDWLVNHIEKSDKQYVGII